MNFNNFTIKSQEAIQKAVEIAKGSGNQASLTSAVHPTMYCRKLLTLPRNRATNT